VIVISIRVREGKRLARGFATGKSLLEILKFPLDCFEASRNTEPATSVMASWTRRIPMAEPKVVHDTFVIERSFLKPPETVFAAFSDPAKMRRWFGEGDHHDVEVFVHDFRVGGEQNLTYRLKEGSPFPGVAIANVGRFQEIAQDKRIVIASTMDLGGKRI
jgi:hypothetical protein